MGDDPISPDAQDPDWQVLARAAEGDGAAFEQLVRSHQGRLLRLCERLLGDAQEAQDAVQEVFLRVYRKAGAFRPRGRVYTWLYRIATNYCLNRLRRRKVVRFVQLSEPASGAEDSGGWTSDPPDRAPDPHQTLEARRRWQATRRRLEALPPGQHGVVVLVKFEGCSYREAARALGITVGAVESRLFRAMRALEKAQEKDASGVSKKEER